MKIQVNPTLLTALFVVLYCNAGMLGFIKGSILVTLLAYGAVLAWVILASTIDQALIAKFFTVSYPIVAFFVLILLGSVVADSTVKKHISSMGNNILFFLVFVMMMIYYSEPGRSKDRKTILTVWIVDTIIASIYTIYRLEENPMLSRLLASDIGRASLDSSVSIAGVLGYGSIYGLSLFVIAWFHIIGKAKNTQKFLMICCELLFLYTIIEAQFFIAFMISIIGFIVNLIVGDNRNAAKKWLVLIFVSPLILAFGYFMIVIWLPKLIQNEVLPPFIADRLSMFIEGTSMSELLSTDRGVVYLKSISAIINSKGLGVLFWGNTHVGGHSEILDLIGNFGVFLAALFIFGMWSIKNSTSRLFDSRFRRCHNIVWFIFVIIALLNTALWCTTTLVLLLIIPLLYLESQQKYSQEDLYENRLYQS